MQGLLKPGCGGLVVSKHYFRAAETAESMSLLESVTERLLVAHDLLQEVLRRRCVALAHTDMCEQVERIGFERAVAAGMRRRKVGMGTVLCRRVRASIH